MRMRRIRCACRAQGRAHVSWMFSNPLNPPSVVAARATQRAHMRAWVAKAAERRARAGPGSVTA